MIDGESIWQRWEAVGSKLDERGRRLFAAAEARTAGWGGLAMVSKITGLARSTINRGEDDLDAEPLPKGQVRRVGGGRRALREDDPGLVGALERLVEPATLGDPMRPLIWVSKSMEKLAAALTEMGHPISADTVRKELVKLGFSRQSNRKADEGSHHPDRNAQFEYINAKAVAAQRQHQPVISVDTKKKELIGNFKNGGTDYRPKGNPQRVNVHDFEDKKLGKVVPYGVYDVTADAGFVSVGITSDTAEFAVASIRCWHDRMGRARYPKARELTITADCGRKGLAPSTPCRSPGALANDPQRSLGRQSSLGLKCSQTVRSKRGIVLCCMEMTAAEGSHGNPHQAARIRIHARRCSCAFVLAAVRASPAIKDAPPRHRRGHAAQWAVMGRV